MKRAILAFALFAAVFGVVGKGSAQDASAASVDKAVFAGGCFWCMQPPFDRAPGVISTLVGYAGGSEPNPTYKQVSAGETGHRESIEVTYDPTKISYAKLLEIFWHNINPIQTDGQFHDIGHQYTSAIFYNTDQQKKIAEESKDNLAKSGKFQKPIATVILPAGKFWPAEDYHQKYYIKNPIAYAVYHFASGRDSFKQRIWGKGS
jgi:peptide-methionine (S)-S-oxide reductase